MPRSNSKKRRMFHDKIKDRENKIKNTNKEIVDLSTKTVDRVMNKYGISDYRIEIWGDIIARTTFSNWKINTDEEENIVYLYHENERLARKGNHRSRYHIHNVFYDLDFCVKSIVEHEEYKKQKLKGKKHNRDIPPT